MATAAMNLGITAGGLVSKPAITAARLNQGLCSEIRFGGCDWRQPFIKHRRLSCFHVNNSPSVSAPSPKMKALKDLGLNVVKGSALTDSSGIHNKFSITLADTGRKVENPELLEAIRLTIISNLLKYHPESSIQLAMGEAFGIMPPKEKPDVDIATHINIYNDDLKRSLLYVETADRPGLLLEIVKAIADISVSVESGEFDTQGLLAKARFHVSYHGACLSRSLQEVLTNSLRYFLRRPFTEEASF